MTIYYNDTADFGDYINSADSDEYSDMEMEVEKYLKYYLPRLGSWYPVQIGEVLEQRYQVLHKLGHGGFSTVWMARDLHNQKDVALKIVMSGIDGYSSGEYEYSMHNLIKERVMDTSSLVLYLSTFYVEGNYGATHRVFVLPLCGPSFQVTCKLNGGLKEIRNHMPAARQLLLALKSLHDAGIVHRGEYLSAQNPADGLLMCFRSKHGSCHVGYDSARSV
jgi:serine/threonine protein kinase